MWKTIEGCGGNELCAYAAYVTEEYNRKAGRLNDGVTIRGAKTDGRVVTVEMIVPERIKQEFATNGTGAGRVLVQDLQRGACSRKGAERFFQLGGELRVQTYLPSGEPYSTSTVNSC